MPSVSAPSTASVRRRAIRRIRRLVAGALTVALVVWGGTLAYESLDGSSPRVGATDTTAGATASETEAPAVGDDSLLEIDSDGGAEESPDLTVTLPDAVDNWVVEGPQPVPGAEGQAVEAVFEPLDEQLSLAASVTVYAVVRLMESPEAAARALETLISERYPESRAVVTLDARDVSTGFGAGSSSYFVGWVSGKLVVGIDAGYKQSVPKSRTQELLRKAAEAVANAVSQSVRESGIG